MSRAPRRLGDALAGLERDVAPATTLAEVQRVWAGVVGPAVAREALPTGEREGVLTVACRASVWAQELDLMGPRIVTGLNAAIGREAVSRLRCVATLPPSA